MDADVSDLHASCHSVFDLEASAQITAGGLVKPRNPPGNNAREPAYNMGV